METKPNPLIALLKAHPNCRVTITVSRKRKHPRKPKPQSGDLKQRGRYWYRWDYARTREGHTIVGPRGAYRWSWYYQRDANPEEYQSWKAARKAARELKKQTSA